MAYQAKQSDGFDWGDMGANSKGRQCANKKDKSMRGAMQGGI